MCFMLFSLFKLFHLYINILYIICIISWPVIKPHSVCYYPSQTRWWILAAVPMVSLLMTLPIPLPAWWRANVIIQQSFWLWLIKLVLKEIFWLLHFRLRDTRYFKKNVCFRKLRYNLAYEALQDLSHIQNPGWWQFWKFQETHIEQNNSSMWRIKISSIINIQKKFLQHHNCLKQEIPMWFSMLHNGLF